MSESTAPSAPRNVTVRIVTPVIVEVKWKAPAAPLGVIVLYTVYVTPLNTGIDQPTRKKRQTSSEGVQIIKQVSHHIITQRTCVRAAGLMSVCQF